MLISVIIVSFNNRALLESCLKTVFLHPRENIEVIVVDNGSTDNTADLVKDNYPQVILLKNEANLGACAARNQGIKVSRGEWILTLDSDAFLSETFFPEIFRVIKDLPSRTGIIQPKVLSPDKTAISSCGIYVSWFRRFYDIGKGQKDSERFNKARNIFGACSACALYKKDMLEHIEEDTGYFDERFFFLVEDVDLSWRAKRKGWQTLFYPKAVCYHSANGSATKTKKRQYLCFRNRYYTIKKNEGLLSYFINIWPVTLADRN